ncbi:hypothetical protein FGADI_12603 [Fusarium gaditjirri]|uniref:Uncharacterized protein n=1 Tax=Fusarium gaditjirri TaxID=282569 RepID=A0A8H4SSD7_9HYPO|nr:hypothetical protein FGADI_12603 [Fusarium gaditjirri]
MFESGIAEVERKVANMRVITPSVRPTNRQAWGMLLDDEGNLIKPHMVPTLTTNQLQTYLKVMFHMDVHKAVLRGTGFYEALSKKENGLSIGALPSMCYRLCGDRLLMQCIIEEARYYQQNRFREYLTGRELHIGLIIGPPGSGRTTLGAAATLAVQVQQGQILCSGPSHTSIDNFAKRLDEGARAVAARYNTVTPEGDAERCRHRLVIRMFRPGDDINAVAEIVNNPQDIDWVPRRGEFSPKIHWKLHLSLAYWSLAVLRSSVVPPLHVDSKPGLLRQWVAGKISTQQYAATPGAVSNLNKVMCETMCQADFLCVHASDAETSSINYWKNILARGLAVDEAGSMSRADFYGLWGYTLLPCFLSGDPNEQPVVLTTDERDADGNLYNRFAADGAVSPLKFLMATGVPVFRLDGPIQR